MFYNVNPTARYSRPLGEDIGMLRALKTTKVACSYTGNGCCWFHTPQQTQDQFSVGQMPEGKKIPRPFLRMPCVGGASGRRLLASWLGGVAGVVDSNPLYEPARVVIYKSKCVSVMGVKRPHSLTNLFSTRQNGLIVKQASHFTIPIFELDPFFTSRRGCIIK